VIRHRHLPYSVASGLLALLGALFAAALVVPPDFVAAHMSMLRALLFVALSLAVAISVPAHVFFAGAVLLLGISSGVAPRSFGSMTLYTYDLLLFFVLVRAIVPRVRVPSGLDLVDVVVAAPLALWSVLLVSAGVRGILAGNSLGQVARLETALVYFPLFCWGFTRIVREQDARLSRVTKACALAALGLIAYAAFARLTHERFGHHSGRGIGVVPTTAGNLRRDYGYYSAFEIYPLLALGAFAYLCFARRATAGAVVLVSAGLAATIFTLIRGLIFGLAVGAVVALAYALRERWQVRLGRRLLPLGVVAAVATVALFIFSPVSARGVAERVLPGVLPQSQIASGSSKIRWQVFATATHVASKEPFGVGFVSSDDVAKAGYDPERIPENQWAALLVFTGWPGVVLLLWGGVVLVRRSARLPAAAPWLHPLVAATAALVLVQGFGWNVLFGLTWSLGLLGLVLALRLSPYWRPYEDNESGPQEAV
jgi:O-Antigen ligase